MGIHAPILCLSELTNGRYGHQDRKTPFSESNISCYEAGWLISKD